MVLSYKEAGVDISQIKKSHASIGKILSSTYLLQRKVKVEHGFGHYAGLVNISKDTLLAVHTDGVGTKVMIAQQMKKYDTIGIDCIAMNVNDIICTGAVPISFVDYIAVNKNDPAILKQIVSGLAKGAVKAAVPVVGGETAVMPDLIAGDEFAFDIAGTVVGLVSKKKLILGNSIKIGDIIIGAKSTGIHSNGYTLVRKSLLTKFSLTDSIRGVGKLGSSLLKPTEIYVKPVLEAIDHCNIHGLAHITGGSFTKLLRLKEIGYALDGLPKPPPVMQLLQEQGISSEEMHKTFNMGIGFCVIAPRDQASAIHEIFKKHRIKTYEIGTIISKKGVFINSKQIA